MKNTINFLTVFIYAITLTIFSSCESDIDVNDFKPDASGLRGEILIIMDDYFWEKEAGESVKKYFEVELPGTPQPFEPQLSVRCYPHKNFNRNHKTNKSIVFVEFDEKLAKTSFKLERNKWMKQQTYVEIKCPNMVQFTQFMEKEGENLVEIFLQDELDRVKRHFSASKNTNALKLVKDKQDLNIIFPKEFTIITNNESFFSATYESMVSRNGKMFDLQKGVFIYHYPYTSDNIFNTDYLIQKRNDVLGKNVKGATDNEFMTTNADPRISPVIDTMNLNGEFAVEMRGLWRMENNFMGGPFISLTTIDKKNNRVVTIEGYVFAPNSPKRELIRDLEAILYSVSF